MQTQIPILAELPRASAHLLLELFELVELAWESVDEERPGPAVLHRDDEQV